MYCGIREVDVTEEELASFYEGKIKYDLIANQYLILRCDGKPVDKYKLDKDGKLIKLKYKTIDSPMMGKIKPRNIRQELYFDMLDSDIPLCVVRGVAGGGKSYAATCWALQELDKKNYDKIVFIKNNITVEGVKEIGAVPGDENQKLRGNFAYVSDILNPYMFDVLLQQNKIETVWLGEMRGRSICNSIVICSEAQNLTTNLVKMIITRMGEGSRLIFDFDETQIDRKIFEKDFGMMSLIDSLSGHSMFGLVELIDVERSELAKLASLIK